MGLFRQTGPGTWEVTPAGGRSPTTLQAPAGPDGAPLQAFQLHEARLLKPIEGDAGVYPAGTPVQVEMMPSCQIYIREPGQGCLVMETGAQAGVDFEWA